MPETVVPVFFFLIVIGGPIAAWIISRVLAHQERMEMLRRGFAPPPDPRMMRKAMKYGYGSYQQQQPGTVPPPNWTPPPSPFGYDTGYYAQQQLRRGIQVAFIGFALLIGLSFIGYHGGQYVYGPWLLGGLIPMFVGIAQIISAVLSGAQIGSFGGRGGVGGTTTFGPAESSEPPQGAPTATSNMPPPPGSYGGWRPGPTPEIPKPSPPPDRF